MAYFLPRFVVAYQFMHVSYPLTNWYLDLLYIHLCMYHIHQQTCAQICCCVSISECSMPISRFVPIFVVYSFVDVAYLLADMCLDLLLCIHLWMQHIHQNFFQITVHLVGWQCFLSPGANMFGTSLNSLLPNQVLGPKYCGIVNSVHCT